MCNAYAMTKSQQAIRELAKAMHDRSGNLPPMPGIFPDMVAPVVRNTAEGRELTMMRWGFPPPPNAGRLPVTNVRNVSSGHWRPWLDSAHRCVVPVTSFCEYQDEPDTVTKKKTPHWFAISPERPLFAFAGIWRPWNGARGTKKAPIEGDHLLYSFLTCESNDDVRPIHAKAMPVILQDADEIDAWLEADINDALELQRPLAPGVLQVVMSGEKEDQGG
jgi:putative SOS response-associated peptidase YedK